ncbi:uncharacterized protein EDB91DRAFT_1043631 [Suillus paluster]|uniref:uncharacterized protein n=1 Tax=Suillus paluster TaxID=48578 RepID=UPI001B866F2D|nr:uncharacterized protein EDB91DRAFT_1043631 [Suillus paluster]KAG1753555.1 hypothetical protein EDB91DRAFT_1043631 [Suillus paluster]
MSDLLPSIRRFDRTEIPDDVWETLRDNAARANVILPHAKKVFDDQDSLPGSEQLWLVYSKPGTSNIKLILSCTEGPQGKYPIFIVPTAPIAELTPELLQSAMEAFCKALLDGAHSRKQRVFSVFSVKPVAEAFASAWKTLTQINCIPKPYYDAIFMTCSRETLIRAAPPTEDEVIELRRAISQDADKIAVLCEKFPGLRYDPFVLTPEQASQEAALLIDNNQAWVYEVRESNDETDIASIVAVTRDSTTVAAITKVYTPDIWRGKGRAERLVRRVCRELLKTHEQVVLYVGVDNHAKKVYDRVGFQGLSEGFPTIDGAEHWVEIGFDRAEVTLGHW